MMKQLKKIGETLNHRSGLATWQSLGLILSMVTVGAYGGPRMMVVCNPLGFYVAFFLGIIRG